MPAAQLRQSHGSMEERTWFIAKSVVPQAVMIMHYPTYGTVFWQDLDCSQLLLPAQRQFVYGVLMHLKVCQDKAPRQTISSGICVLLRAPEQAQVEGGRQPAPGVGELRVRNHRTVKSLTRRVCTKNRQALRTTGDLEPRGALPEANSLERCL